MIGLGKNRKNLLESSAVILINLINRDERLLPSNSPVEIALDTHCLQTKSK